METLSNKDVNLELSNSLIRVGDLANFEGPLLTLFEDTRNGHLYLFDWVDRDSVSNRWLVYRVSPSALLEFLDKKISHLNLFKSNPDNQFYFTDIENKNRIIDCLLFKLISVPSKYAPPHDNIFDEVDCPHLGKIRAIANRELSRTKRDELYA
jgi:hypothetical protein